MNEPIQPPSPPPCNPDERFFYQQDFIDFCIPIPDCLELMTKGSEIDNKIKEWLPDCQLQRLYKATWDGFSGKDFHRLCDNKGPTLTLIRSQEGYLFGGFSVESWDSTSYGKHHSQGFIFTLTNPHNIPPTVYQRNPEKRESIYCVARHGPSFGIGDIRVADKSNHNFDSCTKFGPYSCYKDTTGKGYCTFTGEWCFTTSEIEVYAVLYPERESE